MVLSHLDYSWGSPLGVLPGLLLLGFKLPDFQGLIDVSGAGVVKVLKCPVHAFTHLQPDDFIGWPVSAAILELNV